MEQTRSAAGPHLVDAPSAADVVRVVDHLQSVTDQRSIGLARRLHDELGGLLVSVMMDLSSAYQSPELGDSLRLRLGRAHKSIATAVDFNRRLIEELRPTLLDNFGLLAAYRWFIRDMCARRGATCSEHYLVHEPKLRPEALTGLFRLMQELLAVVLDEPRVESVQVSVTQEHDTLSLQLAHVHVGAESIDMFENAANQMHATLLRATALEGRYFIERQERGTVVSVRFPLRSIALGSIVEQ